MGVRKGGHALGSLRIVIIHAVLWEANGDLVLVAFGCREEELSRGPVSNANRHLHECSLAAPKPRIELTICFYGFNVTNNDTSPFEMTVVRFPNRAEGSHVDRKRRTQTTIYATTTRRF